MKNGRIKGRRKKLNQRKMEQRRGNSHLKSSNNDHLHEIERHNNKSVVEQSSRCGNIHLVPDIESQIVTGDSANKSDNEKKRKRLDEVNEMTEDNITDERQGKSIKKLKICSSRLEICARDQKKLECFTFSDAFRDSADDEDYEIQVILRKKRLTIQEQYNVDTIAYLQAIGRRLEDIYGLKSPKYQEFLLRNPGLFEI